MLRRLVTENANSLFLGFFCAITFGAMATGLLALRQVRLGLIFSVVDICLSTNCRLLMATHYHRSGDFIYQSFEIFSLLMALMALYLTTFQFR